MRACADHLYHAADGAFLDQLAGKHGALHVQAFAVIDPPFEPRLFRFPSCPIDLLQRGKGRLIGKIMLAVLHRPKP
ncbi:hypothetical protein D3C76_1809070 [compost metagenome]